MFDHLAPARRRLVLVVVAALVAGLLAAAVVVGVRVVVDVDPASQADQGPVLVVPGYGGSTDSVQGLAAALRADGREVAVVELAGDGKGDLHEQAEVLDAAVDAALASTGEPSVDVVGYSAGGVIARLWVRDLGGDALARRVVTLGSPHHGTELAGVGSEVGCPEACLQLAPGSDLLRGLNAGDETPDGPVFVSVWTTDDETVTPPESAELAGALNLSVQSICADAEVSHGDLPDDPVAQALVESALASALPSVPPCPAAGG